MIFNPSCNLTFQNHQNCVIAKEKGCAATLNLKQSQLKFTKNIEIARRSLPLRSQGQ
jgi:hypothetical protein